MNEKEFYKHIRLAIKLSMNRCYRGIHFEECEKIKEATIRSLFREYKIDYPFKESICK